MECGMLLGCGYVAFGAANFLFVESGAARCFVPPSASAGGEKNLTGALVQKVQLGYVSRQLGHSDVSVTARHYARWAGGDAYRSPLEVREYEVPADLLSRLAESPYRIPYSAVLA